MNWSSWWIPASTPWPFPSFPTSIRELIELADQDQIMPPKSTWFEPKLRSGLVVHLLS